MGKMVTNLVRFPFGKRMKQICDNVGPIDRIMRRTFYEQFIKNKGTIVDIAAERRIRATE